MEQNTTATALSAAAPTEQKATAASTTKRKKSKKSSEQAQKELKKIDEKIRELQIERQKKQKKLQEINSLEKGQINTNLLKIIEVWNKNCKNLPWHEMPTEIKNTLYSHNTTTETNTEAEKNIQNLVNVWAKKNNISEKNIAEKLSEQLEIQTNAKTILSLMCGWVLRNNKFDEYTDLSEIQSKITITQNIVQKREIWGKILNQDELMLNTEVANLIRNLFKRLALMAKF